MKQSLRVIALLGLLAVAAYGCGPKVLKPTDAQFTPPRVIPPPQPDISFEKMMEMEETESGSYLLGPGDTITIYVYGEETLTRTVTLEPNGRFTFPLVGEIKAKGRQVADVIKELDERLDKYLKGAKTDIIINQFASNQFVLIGGGVKTPGTFITNGEVRLLEAIAMAGGFTTIQMNEIEIPGADLSRAYLSRGQNILPIDFEALVLSGDMRYNIRVRPRDIVYVPLMTSREIWVLGQVNAPSVVPMIGPTPISKAIALAGGFNTIADPDEVLVIRNSASAPMVFEIDVEKIMKGRMKDFMLQPGDLVFVPESIL